jgi:hypothetical protein
MTCYATRRPVLDRHGQLKDKGWVCNGEDLTIVLPASATLPPVVVRRDLLPLLLIDEAYRRAYEHFAGRCGPFLDGGDHLHAMLPHVSRWRRLLLRLGIGS